MNRVRTGSDSDLVRLLHEQIQKVCPVEATLVVWIVIVPIVIVITIIPRPIDQDTPSLQPSKIIMVEIAIAKAPAPPEVVVIEISIAKTSEANPVIKPPAWSSAVPSAIAGIVAVNKLFTLPVKSIEVATATTPSTPLRE